MAEFQSATAAIGLARDVIDLVKYLKEVKEAIGTVESDIDGLIVELRSLERLYTKLDAIYQQQPNDGTRNLQQREFLSQVRETLKAGKATYYKFEEELKSVYGEDPKTHGWFDAFKKQHKLRSRLPKMNAFRSQIQRFNIALQLQLTQISLINQDNSRDFERTTSTLLQDLVDGIRNLDERLESRKQDRNDGDTTITFDEVSSITLKRVKTALQMDEGGSINKHFDVPSSVDSNYVGRERQAEKLAASLFAQTPAQSHQQKRFVVYGVGGSGKTQFCCKFAQDHQHTFWGVFWIDGRSHKQLKQSLIQNVAKVGGVDKNHRAALNWLANQQERWLLIIDNADDASIDLRDYLPRGERGYVLITTRNPGFQSLGNVEPRFFKFDGLDEKDANALLFKTAGLSGLPEESQLAAKIVDFLGYLALAISVAGSAIRAGACYLHNYLQYFEDLWNRRRTALHLTRSIDNFEEMREARVEATFEVSYQAISSKDNDQISRDALELLKTFAFLHCENVRYKFLDDCIKNAKKEDKQRQEEKERRDKEAVTAKRRGFAPSKTWRDWLGDLRIQLWVALQGIRGPEILPAILHDGKRRRELDYFRLQRAMSRLLEYSLVMYNSVNDSWSMHPLVHRWAQRVIDSRVGEQYLWCEAAATLLCNCVYIEDIDEELMRDLLPHVDAVRDNQKKVEHRMTDNRMSRMKLWPLFEPSASRRRAMMLVKFSIVYASNGRWEEAEKLQRVVQRFLLDVFGFGQLNTRRITRVLAETLYHLGHCDESAKMLEELVTACTTYRGPNDRETLVAISKLGDSRWLQGRVSEARRLFETSLKGMEEQFSSDDEDHLNAKDYLGKALRIYATDEMLGKAKKLHQSTMTARARTLPKNDLKTLTSRELYYTLAVWTKDPQDLLAAEVGLDEIVEIRKTKLGREHAFTLMGTLFLAQVKALLGKFEDAEELFDNCLPIAERNHGRDHPGVQFAYFCKGRMRCLQQRWKEARDILVDVTERQKKSLQGWGAQHLDRLGGLLELVKAHDALRENVERNAVATEALQIFEKITTVDHPWAKKLRAQLAEWKDQATPAAGAGE